MVTHNATSLGAPADGAGGCGDATDDSGDDSGGEEGEGGHTKGANKHAPWDWVRH